MCGDAGLKDIERSKKVTGHKEFKIIVGDEFLIQVELLQKLFTQLFKKETKIRFERIEKGEHFYYLNPTSRKIYEFLTHEFDFPPGSKIESIKVPKIILNGSSETRRWFARGIFDSDGAVKTVEKANRRIGGNLVYLNMKSKFFINQIYEIVQNDFNVNFFEPSSNGKDECWKIGTGSFKIVKTLNKQKIFIHPIKRWRLERLALMIKGL